MSTSTLGHLGASAIERASKALGLAARAPDALSTFEKLSRSWAGRSASTRVPSFHTPDGSPMELSTPLGGSRRELRFTVEPQGEPFGHRSNWRAGIATLEAIRGLPGVSLEPIERALSAFEPRTDEGFGFAMWLGAVFGPTGPARFKIYFDASFAEAHATSWQDVVAAAVGDGPVRELEEAVSDPRHVGIVSYDLASGTEARVKLYVAHAEPGPRSAPAAIELASVERVEALGVHCRAGDARALVQTFAPEGVDPASSVPVFVGSTVHILEGTIDRVTTNACFLPFGPDAPPPSQVRVNRAKSVAKALQTTAEPLEAFLAATAPARMPLTYLSVQREGERPRLTAYASPMLYDL